MRNNVNPKLRATEIKCNRLQTTKFFVAFLALWMTLTILSNSFVLSLNSNQVLINSNGRIGTIEMKTANRSELRGIFFQGANYGHDLLSADWGLMAQTVDELDFTDAFIDLGGLPNDGSRMSMIPEITSSFHSVGMNVHITFNVLIYGRTQPYEMRAIDSAGAYVNWGCPIRAKNFLISQVQEIAAYDIDGFMFDYTRYWNDNTDICFCDECKTAFTEWLGEGEITDWNQFYAGGARHLDYLHWRSEPINELVESIHDSMLIINPNLEFSAATFPLGDDAPSYWKKWMGQDVATWIKNGFLDFVCPMQYTPDVDNIQMRIENHQNYWTAGVEGQIPLAIFITNCYPSTYTTTEFANVVNAIRESGADGWIVWRYGGPGNYVGDTAPDIRDYIEIIDMPETFTISNVQVDVNETDALISWLTDKPATTQVEYSNSSLFAWDWRIWYDTGYWNPEHVAGNITTPTTIHNITLTDLQPETKYFFRVQSEGASGTVTTKVMTFTTGS